MDLILRRDGRFTHEGIEITHPRLHRAFLRGVRWAEAEGTFVVQLGRFRGWLDVEDTAFWIVAYDEASGTVEVSDGSCESLDAATLRVDPDDALRCTVKTRFPARFTHAGQAHLLAAVAVEDGAVRVRAGDDWLHAPDLDGLA